MATIVTGEMSEREYMEYTLSGKRTKLEDYTKAKMFSLPSPLNRPGLTKEADELKRIKLELDKAGIWYKRIDTAGKIMGDRLIPSQMKGFPDVVAIYGGKFIGIEVKARGGRVSGEQITCLQGIIAAGGRACICTNPTLVVKFIMGDIKIIHELMGVPVL